MSSSSNSSSNEPVNIHEETLSIEDLLYLKVAISIVQSNRKLRHGMPETYTAMGPLKEKIERLLHKEVDKRN